MLATGNLESCALRVRITPAAGDTSSQVRLEIRVKTLGTSNAADSLTTGVWTRFSQASAGTDSIGTNNTTYQALTGPRWRSFLVNFDPRQYPQYVLLPLWGNRSEPYVSPFTQIVVRCIGDLGAGKPRVRVDVIGKKIRG